MASFTGSRLQRGLALFTAALVVSAGFVIASLLKSAAIWAILLTALAFFGATESYDHLWRRRRFWLHALWLVSLGALVAGFVIQHQQERLVAIALPLMLVQGLGFWWAIGWLNSRTNTARDEQRRVR